MSNPNRIAIDLIPYHGKRARPKCEFRYYVTGCGQFPYDMLRYDSAIPFTEHDARAMARDTEQRSIEVRAQGCTPGRWDSFGWKVTGQWIEERKIV